MSRAWVLMMGTVAASAACGKSGGGSDKVDDTGVGNEIADCALLATWADDMTPTSTRHVAVTGNDETGDGSESNPYATLARAAQELAPGTAISVHSGTYDGGIVLQNLPGKADGPLWIGGAPGEPAPIIDGTDKDYGLRLVKPTNLIVHDLELTGGNMSGLTVDDDNDTVHFGDTNHVIVSKVAVHDVTGDGADCMRLLGIQNVRVLDSSVETCGGAETGNGINMVGVADGLIARSRVHDTVSNGIQVKGGSQNVEIRWTAVGKGGKRGVNMGGMTDPERFRPPLDATAENFEAKDIRLLASLVEGGRESVALDGCLECSVADNTLVEPRSSAIRITQETFSSDAYTFAGPRDALVGDNIVTFESKSVQFPVLVDEGLMGGKMQFISNLWYATDNPGASAPVLPSPETGQVAGLDPAFGEGYTIDASSPAAGAGSALGLVHADLGGTCYADPPSIGAFEVP